VLDKYVDIELCVGNYVLSSGEVAALVVVDAVYRLLEGVISPESLNEESFGENGLLEYPHYTRPEEFQGVRVPEVLLSGNHAAIRAWRRRMRIEKTKVFRPELLWNWEGVKNNGSY
jgi:tRNA (guanine37-N1)-methyltransferase